ncbi:[histone H3]-lysine27 N-trimethyltransferase EZH2 [Geosmithia morbida]|uniref:[histone H3]-lysine27 N-trimethyltransferase EZH2 n=1 Tax=Geosmithia morbida TaxID=1094350 RepID=A0A9P4YYD5_9HYPO|nr:[histone H3]-lysine27 N-trimethyltransferase EZH2 [Geosmithia morbida]KAF4125160.1 [histone H3]-lysine27 N-trimethyltransferase EZH2 [Geosmithia morbida]
MPTRSDAEGASWTVPQLVDALKSYRSDMRADYAELARLTIKTTRRTARRFQVQGDIFADLPSSSTAPGPGTWKIRSKDPSGRVREEHFSPTPIKTNKLPVPRYFNHHIEVEGNVVAPQTSMAFYPHKGDLDSPRKQKKWKGFIKELDKSEIRSGLDAIKIDQKRTYVIHYDRIVEVSRYLDTWLENLQIPGLDKWALVKYLVDKNRGKVISADSRSRILAWRSIAESSPVAERGAEMFAEAWKMVFKEVKTNHGVTIPEIDLFDVFQLDEDILACADSQSSEDKNAAEDIGKNTFEDLESKMSTYSSLGCLICFKHSCEHGFYTDDNQRERFSLDKGSIVRRLAEKQRQMGSMGSKGHESRTDGTTPCARKCYHENYVRDYGSPSFRMWTDRERQVIRAMYLSFETTRVGIDPVCHAAIILNRDCCDVYREHQAIGTQLPEPKPAPWVPPEAGVPSLGWYNRYKKKLSKRHGADKYHRPNWDHIRRDIDNVCSVRGCDHDGPCTPENPNCPCASKGQFCEKFCGCSTCHFDEECICIQLNRECDPDLCGSCGAAERADPKNAEDDELHSRGCQNCALQRGVAKRLVMGRSQSHGYGLYAAEDLPKDSFVIEYVGELVSGDEGDRRYIRRQNLFDGTKALSFNFTLLKECDVWIDGARYGNLSRYINHEKAGGQRCNILPRIVLVNGCFRIELRAKRNIKAWEELSFDYGEDFGLDIGEKPRGSRTGRSRKNARRNGSPSRGRGANSDSEPDDDDDEDEDDDDEDEVGSAMEEEEEEVTRPSRKRKRPLREISDEDETENQPAQTKDRRKRTADGRFVSKTTGTAQATHTQGRQARRGRGRATRSRSGGVSRRGGTSATGTGNSTSRQGSEVSVGSSDMAAAPVDQIRKRQRVSRRMVAEIGDSEDEAEGEVNTDEADHAGKNGGGAEAEADEEGGRGGTTPQKRDQPSRTRRKPAKLKDCDLWTLEPKGQS